MPNPPDPMRDAALRQMLWEQRNAGMDPQGAPAGQEMGGSPAPLIPAVARNMGQAADQFVPDAIIAGGRSLLRGTPYQDERNSLQNYRQETALANTPSQVPDPKYLAQTGAQPGQPTFFDNRQQQDAAMQDATNMVMGISGGPPGKGGWKKPNSKVGDIGPGFMDATNGDLYGPYAFHDVSRLPEGVLKNIEGDGGWVMRGTGPGLPRYYTRAEANAGNFENGMSPPNKGIVKALSEPDEMVHGFSGPEYLHAENMPMPGNDGRVIGSVDPTFAKHLPQDATQQPKYFPRGKEPEMPTSGLPDEHPSVDILEAHPELWDKIKATLDKHSSAGKQQSLEPGKDFGTHLRAVDPNNLTSRDRLEIARDALKKQVFSTNKYNALPGENGIDWLKRTNGWDRAQKAAPGLPVQNEPMKP